MPIDSQDIITEQVTHDIVDETIEHSLSEEVVSHIIEAEQGPPGPKGKSAYQIAIDEGFIGTEAEWLASLEKEGQFDLYPHDLVLEYWAAKTI